MRDAHPGGSDETNLYSRFGSDGRIDTASRFKNNGNYLIVPANADLKDSRQEAERVNKIISEYGPLAGVLAMYLDFHDGGTEDWQRSGVPSNEFNGAVKDGTSWDFGYVADRTEIPDWLSEMGGGLENVSGFLVNLFDRKNPTRKAPGWHFGMDPSDYENFEAGVREARADDFYESVIRGMEEELMSFAPRSWRRVEKNTSNVGWEPSATDIETAAARRLGVGLAGHGESDPAVRNDPRVNLFNDLAGKELATRAFCTSHAELGLGSSVLGSRTSWEMPDRETSSFWRILDVPREYEAPRVLGHDGQEANLGLVPGFAHRQELPSFAPTSRWEDLHHTPEAEHKNFGRTRHSFTRRRNHLESGNVMKKAAWNWMR